MDRKLQCAFLYLSLGLLNVPSIMRSRAHFFTVSVIQIHHSCSAVGFLPPDTMQMAQKVCDMSASDARGCEPSQLPEHRAVVM